MAVYDQELYCWKEWNHEEKKTPSCLSTIPLTPMLLRKGQPNQRETLHCAPPHGTLQFNSSTITVRMCVFWSWKRQKLEVKLDFFHRYAQFFQSSPTTSWFYSDVRRRFRWTSSFALECLLIIVCSTEFKCTQCCLEVCILMCSLIVPHRGAT